MVQHNNNNKKYIFLFSFFFFLIFSPVYCLLDFAHFVRNERADLRSFSRITTFCKKKKLKIQILGNILYIYLHFQIGKIDLQARSSQRKTKNENKHLSPPSLPHTHKIL